MPHTQGKLNFPPWAHSQNRGWDPQQHVTKSWLSPHQHWKHAFEIMIEAPSPRNHAPCLDISSQHTFWLSFTRSLQPLNAQIKLRSSAMVFIPHRTVQFYSPLQYRSSSSDPSLKTLSLEDLRFPPKCAPWALFSPNSCCSSCFNIFFNQIWPVLSLFFMCSNIYISTIE